MIDKERITKLAQSYGLKCEFYGDGKTCYLHSAKDYDEWCVKVLDQNDLLLMHKNRNRRKNWLHEQRHFRDFDFMFESIVKHDWFKIGDRTFEGTRIGRLFCQIEDEKKYKKKRVKN